MTGSLVVQRGLKCDMDEPAWRLSGTDTHVHMLAVVHAQMGLPGWAILDAHQTDQTRPDQTGFEGVFWSWGFLGRTGRKAKNKAE